MLRARLVAAAVPMGVSFVVLASACTQDFDAFTPSDMEYAPDGAPIPPGAKDGGGTTIDGGTLPVTDSGTTKPVDAGVDAAPVDCTAKAACYTTKTTCATTCTTTENTCVAGCGNNMGCKNKCKADGTTCTNNCTNTCVTCAGTGCGAGCN